MPCAQATSGFRVRRMSEESLALITERSDKEDRSGKFQFLCAMTPQERFCFGQSPIEGSAAQFESLRRIARSAHRQPRECEERSDLLRLSFGWLVEQV